ncbi:MAG: hypothetical protein EXR65_01700 [Dehalococcoidia bacterium]|nr:hypothetical protein [Dehalococcoidia bacterium]
MTAAPAATAPSAAEPERLLIAVRLEAAGGHDARYLLLRWPDWPHPTLLSCAAPPAGEPLALAVRALLDARLRLRLDGEPRAAARRLPVRMARPREGAQGVGWLRPVAARAVGEPEPDGLLAGVEALPLEQALAALPTALERQALREAAALFD